MALPPPPAGWQRFLVKARFGIGGDFAVLDPETQAQQYFVDGKLGLLAKAEVRDASDMVVYRVAGRIPKTMVISDPGGTEVAVLKGKLFSPIKNSMTLTMASGDTWELEGSFLEKEYSVTAGGRPVVKITQKWVSIRDTYALDVAEGVDTGLALAVLWAVDRWVEQRD